MFHIVYFLNFDNVSLIEIKYNKTNTNKNVIMLINVSSQDRIRTYTNLKCLTHIRFSSCVKGCVYHSAT